MRQSDRDRLAIANTRALLFLMPDDTPLSEKITSELKAALQDAERSNERATEPDRKGVDEQSSEAVSQIQ